MHFFGNEWVLESNCAVIEDAAKEIEQRLKDFGWNEEEIGLFLIAIIEALANAIITLFKMYQSMHFS